MLKDFRIVTEQDDLGEVARCLESQPFFALDTETVGLGRNAPLHGVSLATADQEWYLCLGAEVAFMSLLAEVVKHTLVVGHNIGYDLHMLWRYGVQPPKIADTMIGQFLVDENQGLGLKVLAGTKLRLGDVPDFKDLQRFGKQLTGKGKLDDVTVLDVPLDYAAEYSGKDTRMTYDLYQLTLHELHREGMTDIFWNTKMPFVQLLTDMEETGVWIDQPLLRDMEIEFTQIRDDALCRFLEISGGVSPTSNPQLAKYFYQDLGYEVTLTTSTGNPSVDMLALTRLKAQDKTGAVEALLTYRKYEKLLGTYIDSWKAKLVDGRLYGSFNQLGDSNDDSDRLPRTGRLSSSSPNLQNIPSRGDTGARIRELIAAPEGKVLLDCDYDQLELRIGAHYTKDDNLIRVFHEGGDPHQLTADLCGVPRHIGKVANFLIFYGGGPRKMADTIEKTGKPRPDIKETTAWLEAFGSAYPRIISWKQRVVEYARELGYVKTIGGRKRRLPDLKSPDKSLRGAAERQSCNAVIQGSAADIIEWAMLQMYPLLQQAGARLSAQVHDELLIETPIEVVDELGPEVARLMAAGGEHFNLRVPLATSPHHGKNWTEAKGK